VSFLIETVIEEVLDAMSRFIARRFGMAGCLLLIVGIVGIIGLLVWSLA
jgi:hypothetical protein